LKAELGISNRTTESFMSVAVFLRGKTTTIENLPAAVVYVPAAPSAPAAVVNEVLVERI
jgi:hypothetical protein